MVLTDSSEKLPVEFDLATPVVLSQGQSCPTRGHLAVSGDLFDCQDWGGAATGIWWVEARVLLSVHRTAPDTEKHLAQSVSSAEVEKLWRACVQTQCGFTRWGLWCAILHSFRTRRHEVQTCLSSGA